MLWLQCSHRMLLTTCIPYCTHNMSFGRGWGTPMVKHELLQLGALFFSPTLPATPAPPQKMHALAATQSQDATHHMHSLLLSHGNEWNMSFGRGWGAPMVKHELLQLGALFFFPTLPATSAPPPMSMNMMPTVPLLVTSPRLILPRHDT